MPVMKGLLELGWFDAPGEEMTITATTEQAIPTGQYVCMVDAEGQRKFVRVSAGQSVTVRLDEA
jgi:hypothetical protein